MDAARYPRLVHYSRDSFDELRPLTYEELKENRSSGRWQNDPEAVRKYVAGRKRLENYLRARLRQKAIASDPATSFLYATLDGHEQFGTASEVRHEAELTPDLINASFFDVVGDGKSRTVFGQPGLQIALNRWRKATQDGNLKPTEYMGMTIKPRIEVMTQAKVPITTKTKQAKTDVVASHECSNNADMSESALYTLGSKAYKCLYN